MRKFENKDRRFPLFFFFFVVVFFRFFFFFFLLLLLLFDKTLSFNLDFNLSCGIVV